MAKISVNTDSLKDKKEFKRHKINEGDNVYRILPPFGDEANGYPYRKWVLAWMLDPESNRRRPYSSRSSFGEKDCPVWTYVNLLQERQEKLEKKLIAAGHDEDSISEALTPIKKVIWELKPKSTFFYNACNKAGEVGILELKKTAHDQVKKLMMEYITDYGQDPTSLGADKSDSGVWIKINRTGKDRDTKYTVKKNQLKHKTSEGIQWVDDREALPDNVIENYSDLGYNLNTIYSEIKTDKLQEVLIYNIAAMAKSFNDSGLDGNSIILPGYELKQQEQQKKNKVEVDEDDEPPVKPATKKSVNLKFSTDEEDEEDEVAAIKAKPVAAKTSFSTTKKASVIDQSVLDAAEALLED